MKLWADLLLLPVLDATRFLLAWRPFDATDTGVGTVRNPVMPLLPE